MLAQPGTVLLKDRDTCYFVLMHSPYAVLCWPVLAKKLKRRGGDFAYYEFDLSPAVGLKVVAITKPSSFRVATVRIRSPLYLLKRGFSQQEVHGIFLEHVSTSSYLEPGRGSGA